MRRPPVRERPLPAPHAGRGGPAHQLPPRISHSSKPGSPSMTVSVADAISRPMGVAQRLRETPIDEKAVHSKLVVLTGEPATLATPNGRWCFLDSLALLPRTVGQLLVALPKECAWRDEVQAQCRRAWC